VVISGASGSGKSSLAWYMIHNGYNYLSDELAPVDPKQLRVEVYPHALCLKTEPRTAPPLPESSQFTAFTIHVPAFELPARALDKPCTLNLLIFIGGTLNGEELHVQKISQAESAARLYANGLNQLSHQDEGLPVAASIARRVPSYLISGGTVEERAEAIRAMLETERVL
jgi:hypothetical protein